MASSTSTLLQLCTDLTDIEPLCEEASLFLKPIARVLVAVQLPKSLSSNPSSTIGKSVSNWEVMEKIKHLAKPIVFNMIKVSSSTLEVIKYEGEVDNKDLMAKVMHALDAQTLKLSGFSEVLRVQCAEAKLGFPHRQDWLAYFRDAKNLNETKPGERPDTVILYNLPCKWFAEPETTPASTEFIPSAATVAKIFGTYGKVRATDVPLLDPSRSYLRPSGGNGILTFGHELVFEAYVQFSEYAAFVKCLTALYGTKLLWKDAEGKAFTSNIKVEFDKTQHMNAKNIRKRRHERAEYQRLLKLREEKARIEREDEERKKKLEEEKAVEEQRRQEDARLKREERRRHRRQLAEEKAEKKKLKKEEQKRQKEVAIEERKLLIAQRQLESIRLLSVLFDRLKEKRRVELAEQEKLRLHEEELRKKAEARLQEVTKEKEFQSMLSSKEKELRRNLLKTKDHEERKRKKNDERKVRRKMKRLTGVESLAATSSVDRMAETRRWVEERICYVDNPKQPELITKCKQPSVEKRPKEKTPSPDAEINDMLLDEIFKVDEPVASVERVPSSPVSSLPIPSPSAGARMNSVIVVTSSNKFLYGDDCEEMYQAPQNILYC